MNLASFLHSRAALEDFSTDDILASFLPLVREVIQTHRLGLVAPLEGLEELLVDPPRVWFAEGKRLPERRNIAAIERVEGANRASLEIVEESRRSADLSDGLVQTARGEIGTRGETPTRPVYLPGYVTWEHELQHHDPLTDILSLGLILASLACGLDLTEPEELEVFVTHRRNLFAIRPKLHPVLARAILRMTELDRRRRAQDLPALFHSLENYRDQPVDFTLDLARVAGFQSRDPRTKQQVVVSKLRDRLFDVTKRNTLLQFRQTMQSVNLTQASVPLLLDIRNIQADQLFIADQTLRERIIQGKPISLNKFLNFTEAIYLPSLFERIIADSRRDQHEFGFAQLRLVLCFLSWANLKEKPIEQFVSPLVLLPVQLTKTKGIRDTYWLEPLTAEAEINPVLRHQFRRLYNLPLPETIDLSTAGLETLHEFLAARIQTSEPSVSVNLVDRPRIDLVHDKARRRLDQYRRSARLAGRGVRNYLDYDYSYDPANYHPLGIKLFSSLVRPPSHRLREIIEERPRHRSYMTGDAERGPGGESLPPAAEDPPVVEVERTFFQLRETGDDNPYLWNFDLCNVTLANFHYRRMSLVRDYEAIQDRELRNPAFEATFSLAPRPVGRTLPIVPPLDDRFEVVPCDPTQATAIAEARRGDSYIIQGPPGTGKSQTITNLIADFVAQGKRVLFVCEKRAAIDVVFSRLRQTGLGLLSSLIHDSQSDKKDFILDLKQTYEAMTVEEESSPQRGRSPRLELVRRLDKNLAPLEAFDAAMQACPDQLGLPVRELLNRCVELADDTPEVSPEQAERLPEYGDWWRHRDQLSAFHATIEELQPDGVWSRNPLRLLAPSLVKWERPLERIAGASDMALRWLGELSEKRRRTPIAPDDWCTLDRVRQVLEHFQPLAWFARSGNLELADGSSDRSRSLARSVQRIRELEAELRQTEQTTRHWRKKLSEADTATALEQARRFAGQSIPWLSLAWWRLRGVLRRSYDFGMHAVRPSWVQVLTELQREHDAARTLSQAEQEVRREFQLDRSPQDVEATSKALRERVAALPSWLAAIHQQWISGSDPTGAVERVLAVEPPIQELAKALDQFITHYEHLPFDPMAEEIRAIQGAARQIPRALQLVGEMGQLPAKIGSLLRIEPWTIPQAEGAVARQSWERYCRLNREPGQFNGAQLVRCVGQLERQYDEWLAQNAAEIVARVRSRFLEHLRLANQPGGQLSAEDREFKRRYTQGRRTLEHEFGKSMRYKSIRELVDGDSGLVVQDLKPVWLMSPLSVSDTLPLSDDLFDVVIFDEASQVPLEEAVPAIFRGRQVIVVGDEMQLPPTDFFAAKDAAEDDEELVVIEGGEQVRYDLQSDSFLSHAAKNLSATMLGWHYRSRSESLISFSNWAFYDGRLLTVPDCELPLAKDGAASVESPAGGTRGLERAAVDSALNQPLSFHHLPAAIYDNRRNRGEADYIASLVRDILLRKTGLSIAVIAFSEAQQDEIEASIHRLTLEDEDFRQAYEDELQREVDGQFTGLLVKNLENIQGDERDVVILSVCYGPGPNGKMLMNFGPINKSGGEKRLNVAFSRAKRHMAVVSSILHTQITNEYNTGANCLKNYLRYAESVSRGDGGSARRVLGSMSRWQGGGSFDAMAPDPVCRQLRDALRERGFVVEEGVGQSHFRVDLAVRRDGDRRHLLGLLIDSTQQYETSTPLERELQRPRLLRAFGWRVMNVLAKDWLEQREQVLARVLRELSSASVPERHDG